MFRFFFFERDRGLPICQLLPWIRNCAVWRVHTILPRDTERSYNMAMNLQHEHVCYMSKQHWPWAHISTGWSIAHQIPNAVFCVVLMCHLALFLSGVPPGIVCVISIYVICVSMLGTDRKEPLPSSVPHHACTIVATRFPWGKTPHL